MPNWTENILTIKLKTKKDKQSFINVLEDLKYGTSEFKLDFNTYIPYPKEYKDKDDKSDSDGFNSGGYEWCITHWGTKWNANQISILKDESEFGKLVICFDTAWSPPLPVIENMSQKYNGIEFKLKYKCEGGYGKGTLKFYKGRVISGRYI